VDKDRMEVAARLAASLVRSELEDVPNDFVGTVTVTIDIFRSGVSNAMSDRRRAYTKEAIASGQR